MKDNPIGKKVLFLLSLMVLFLPLLGMAAAEEKTTENRLVEIKVDPRVELISIIFCLARNPEYNHSKFVSYIAAVEDRFGPHREHAVVKLAASLRKKYGVSYDAPMSLTVHLQDANSLQLRLPLEPWPGGLDTRWRPEDVREFLEKARQFTRESKFDDFIQTQQPMYDRAAQRLQKLLNKEAHLEWFDDFFGARPDASFYLFLGMVNGPSNYGSHVKLADREEYYCILGVWKFGILGLSEPKFDKSVLPTIIHEFCHSYANQIVDAHLSQLEKSGEKIFGKVREKMKRMAYGNWQTMMRESLVRACVVRYMAATEGPEAAQRQIKGEVDRGFLWMQELSDLLIRYEQNRDKYPTPDTFFPEVVDFFKNYDMADSK
ncbi:MAG: DUF4932 domain-containing protein [Sedimentisphaerales bacterium]|nr:DUF4932 domain-containing protein [Sedimentisphaerales bacterium]